MARGDVRIAVTLACEECKRRNYQTNKSKRNTPDRITLRKYCRWCRTHTIPQGDPLAGIADRGPRPTARQAAQGAPRPAAGRRRAPSRPRSRSTTFQGPLGQIGEHDVVEAAIVAGAGGEVAEPGATDDVAGVEHPEELSDDAVRRARGSRRRRRGGDGGRRPGARSTSSSTSSTRSRRKAAPRQGRARRARRPSAARPASSPSCAPRWAELQRVQWPDRRQVGQATAVVLGFVVIAGIYLGARRRAGPTRSSDWII